MRQKIPKNTACEFLAEILASGPVESRILVEEGKKQGISKRTLERARSDLGVVHKQIGSKHFCSLPDAQTPALDSSVLDRVEMERRLKDLSYQKTLWDVVGDRIIDAIDKMPPLNFPKLAKPGKLDPVDWALLLSDLHSGHQIDPKSTGGLGSYSAEMLVEQANYLRERILHYLTETHSKPQTLRLFMLGDLIEGITIWHGQRRAVDQGAVDQILWVVEHLVAFVNWLTTKFPHVSVYGVVGNHGRLGRKGEMDPVRDNLDYLCYKFIDQRLSDNPKVSFGISDSWWQMVQVRKLIFLLLHGDDTRAWNSIPFYGANRTSANWMRLLSELGLDPAIQFDYLCMGHHHTKAHFGSVLMNGAWTGGSEYSLKRLALGERPSQKLFAINDEGLDWVRDVQLRPLDSEVKVEVFQ